MSAAFLVLATLCILTGAAQGQQSLAWGTLPDLPAPLGVAGPYVGISEDALIVAGGANFPEPVWETEKVWHDAIYVLQKDGLGGYRWSPTVFHLERPLGYGASATTPYGIVCIGGNDAASHYSDVFLLRWLPAEQKIARKKLPPLPTPLAYSCAAFLGDMVYLAGGCTTGDLATAQRVFLRIDLKRIEAGELIQWEPLPAWPGPERAFSVGATQHNGANDCFYLFSGRHEDTNGDVEFLRDAYEFNPAKYDPGLYDAQTDTYAGEAPPWRRRADAPRAVAAGTGIAVGQSHVFILGGDDGSLFAQTDVLRDAHPGFPKEVLAYHTITDTWTVAGSMPANHVTTTAVRWGTDTINDPVVIPTGEVRPRVRTTEVRTVRPEIKAGSFGPLDLSVLGAYLVGMLAVGAYFTTRNKDSDDFFRGGQQVPWLVAGLSIFATMLSSITFMAIPAKSFATDWVYFMYNMMAIAITPLVILLFLPFFRKIDATSAYEYLELRFNRFARMFASASFVLFQIGRMAVVMYLPALALSAITPLSEAQCILLMGVLSIVYCTLGGLMAVVWTDAIQSVVLLGGALASVVLILWRVDGGISGFLATAAAHDKFRIAEMDFSAASYATSALWVMVLGGIAQNLVPYTSDMAVVQRYMSVPDMGRAKRAIWTNAVAVLPASLLFFGVGTALFVFYKQFPERLDPAFKTDAIFPLFIARELPMGVSGVVVAGIFAAAQSTIATSMHSTATALVTDFARPLRLVSSERASLLLGRVLTFTMGAMGTLLALRFAQADIASLWDQFMTILGYFGGAMCGLFCLGIFTTRANGYGAIVGAFAGAAGVYWVQRNTDVHMLLYAFLGISVCVAAGYVASFAFATTDKDIHGLTIYTMGDSKS